MSAAHLQQRSSQSHSPTQRAFMMTLSRSFLLTERVRARTQHQHLMTQLPFLIKGDAWPRVGVFMLYLPPLYHYLPSLMRKEKNAFTFNLNTTGSARRASVLFWHFISTIYSSLSGWRMHIAWLGSTPGKLNRLKSCTLVSCDKPRWYQCTW